MILDFHTHLGDIFPPYHGIQLQNPAPLPRYLMISSPAIVDLDRLLYRNRPRWWSQGFLKHVFMTLRQRKRCLQGMVSPNLLSDMQRHEIEKSVVLPIEYLDGIPRSRFLLQTCQQVRSLIPFCSVHPQDPRRIEKLHEYIRMGARGMKLHPVFQRVTGDDPCIFELCAEYAPYRLPLILHSGLTGRERRGTHRRFAALELLQSIPAHFPQIPVIFAHAGMAQFELALTLVKRCENLYLELSGQPAQHIRQALRVIGSEHLLFGSDWPFWPQTFALHALRHALGGNTAAEARILWENARSILGLEAE